MKIHSLSDFQPAAGRCAILVDTSVASTGFEATLEDAFFVSNPSETQGLDIDTFVFVDSPPRLVEDVVERGRLSNSVRLEYWAPRTNVNNLVEALRSLSNFTVIGLHSYSQWACFAISRENSGRNSEDFLSGILLPIVLADIETSERVTISNPEISVRSLLISRLIPKVKPFKRFLPHSFIILLYKGLEKIR